MHVCEVFNVYLHTAYKHNAFVTVNHIHTRRLYSCLHTKHQKKTRSAHIPHTFAFGNRLGSNIHAFVMVRYQTHTRTLLLVTRHICVCLIFCDIASKHIRVYNQTLHIPPEKSKIKPGTHEMHILVRRAHIVVVVCILLLGCLRPQATKYIFKNEFNLFDLTLCGAKCLPYSVCRNQYWKRCAAAACA